MYFATLHAEEIGRAIMGRVQKYYSNTRVMEIAQKQRIAYRYYYDLGLDWAGWGGLGTTNGMQRGGEQGELALIRINHARSLVRGQIAMISNAKFDRKPRAASDEWDAMRATIQCGYVLDHYKQSGGLEQRRLERIESASTVGEGFTHYGFDMNLGREYGRNPETNKIEHTGDVFSQNMMSWDVIRDPYKEWEQQRHITAHFPRVNKWELIAQYPAFAEKILNAPLQSVAPYFTPVGNTSDGPGNDDVEIYILYHLPSSIPGLERGLSVKLLGDGTVLETRDLDTGVFPVTRVAEAPIFGSPFGYPSFWEYLGVQELYDNLQSIVATNQSTFGAQNIGVKTGVDPRPIQMAGGMNVWVSNDPAKDIVPLQLTKSPTEVFPHMQDLRRNMELLSGQTSINRGEAQGERQSGAMGALLSAESVKNASPYQTSDMEAQKMESKIILRLLRANAKRPIKIGISARGQTPYDMAIVGHDLGQTDDVDIVLAPPLQQTDEGRIAILQTMAQNKIPLKPEQFMEVITFGRLEPVTDGATSVGMRIRLENQQIAKGIVPRVMMSDNAIQHCTEHATVMSDAGRNDPQVQAAFVAHVEEHYKNFYGSDPEQDKLTGLYRPKMLTLFGIQPPPPDPSAVPPGANPGMTAPPAPGEASHTPPPDQGEASVSASGAQPPPGSAPGKQPHLPTNPATHEKWTPQGQGGTNHVTPSA